MDKEQKNIIQYYGAFAATIVFALVPLAIAQLFSLCLLLAVLIGAYIFKMRSKIDSLAYNHMTYLIGTIWIGSLFLVIGLGIAIIWVYAKGDHTHIQGLLDAMNTGAVYGPEQIQTTMQNYITVNMRLLITATVSTIGPSFLYMIYRTASGLSRASKGYRMARPAGWF